MVDVEDVASSIDWQEFEGFVAEIFRANDFRVKQNFRFKTSRRFEIDLVASNGNMILCVDCKQWAGGRYKKSALKKAVHEQKMRVKEIKKFLKRNIIAQKTLKYGDQFEPLIVTLMEEELVNENDVWLVPVWKLNNFFVEKEK